MSKQTRITLKAIKHSEFASEETHCYEASVYFDGKRVGKVGNDGHGGCDHEMVTDRDGWSAMQDFIKTLPAVEFHGMELPQDLEMICGELVNEHLASKDLKRSMSKKAVFLIGDEVYTLGYRGGRKPDANLFEQVKKQYPSAVVLNEMDFAEALSKYRSAA